MKVAVIIPNYNGFYLLKNNLARVIKLSPECQIIVVDDCSSDGSPEYVENNFPEVKLIKSKINRGFASTVNIGVEKAESDLVYLLNSDVCPEKDYIKKALIHFKNKKTFAVGSMQICKESSTTIMRGRGIGFFDGFLVHRRANVNKSDTLWVSGGAGMFSRKLWMKLGGMYDLYDPFYWEDVDISYRARKSGYRLIFEKKSRVVHEQTKGSIRSIYTKDQINKIALRNQLYFVWLNITDPEYFIKHFIWLISKLLKSAVMKDKVLLQAFIKAMKNIRKVYVLRKKNKANFILHDKDII